MSNVYPGVYKAVVRDPNDPTNQGRARLVIPSVLGQATSAWAMPVLGKNGSDAASVGDQVWVVFENGDINRPTWFGALPERYLPTTHSHDPESLHQNPSLDATAYSTVGPGSAEVASRLMPTGWSWFWNGGAMRPSLESDRTTTAFSKGQSVKITQHVTGSYQVLSSSIFAVTTGSVITVSAWVKGNGPRAFISIFTAEAGGAPDYFGSLSTTSSNTPVVPSADWQKISHSFVVPYNHTQARFVVRTDTQSGTGTIWVDETTSLVTPPAPVGVITGEIKMWPTAAAPAGYLFCNGGTFSSVTYPALAALLGDTYGIHSGTTYYLPDFRGRTPLGVGTASPAVPGGTAHTLGQKGGEERHTQTLAELASHTHTGSTGTGYVYGVNRVMSAAGSGVAGNHGVGYAGGIVTDLPDGGDSLWSAHYHNFTTAASGSSTAFNVLDPYLGINFIIKT